MLERTKQNVSIHIPPVGIRRLNWIGPFGCIVVLVVTAYGSWWAIANAVGFFDEHDPLRPTYWGFALFMIPFWIGWVQLLWLLAKSAGTGRTIRIDARSQVMETHEEFLWWSRDQQIELSRVRHAQTYQPTIRGESCVAAYSCGVKVEWDTGWFPIPCQTPDEQNRLIREVNDFLNSVRCPRDP